MDKIEFSPDGKIAGGCVDAVKGLLVGRNRYTIVKPHYMKFYSSGKVASMRIFTRQDLHFDEDGVSRNISSDKYHNRFSDFPVDTLRGDTVRIYARLTQDYTVRNGGKEIVFKKGDEMGINNNFAVMSGTLRENTDIVIDDNTYRFKKDTILHLHPNDHIAYGILSRILRW